MSVSCGTYRGRYTAYLLIVVVVCRHCGVLYKAVLWQGVSLFDLANAVVAAEDSTDVSDARNVNECALSVVAIQQKFGVSGSR